MQRFSFFIILIFVVISCSEKKTPSKKTITESEITTKVATKEIKKTKKQEQKKDKINSIIPYTDPKDLEELYRTIYVVDTLFSKRIKNEISDEFGDYLIDIYFNKIIGIDTLGEKEDGKIFAALRTSYFDPLFIDGNKYYIPFSTEPEAECYVITIWEKSNEGLKFNSYYKNMICPKYGRLKVTDITNYNNKNYLLIESYFPDEDGSHSCTLHLMEDNGINQSKLIWSKKLGDGYRGNYVACCNFEILDNKLSINNNLSEDHQSFKLELKK